MHLHPHSPKQERLELLITNLELLEEQIRRVKQNQLARYKPYSKQQEFHAAGGQHSERLFMAGNQLGKTYAGAMETAYHLTGRYPDWWQGKRFDNAVRFWVGGKDRIQNREAAQKLLMGPPESEEDWGTGTIPKDCIVSTNRATGVPNALETVTIKHITGQNSVLNFKSYDMRREAWQGATLHGVWFDEEPPLSLYAEGLTRTNRFGQFVYITFTPLLGMSEVVSQFILENDS